MVSKPVSKPIERRKSAGARAQVSNGSKLLAGTDGRGLWARRLRDCFSDLVADKGGTECVTEGERSILRRAATLTVSLEQLEARFAEAGQADAADLDAYNRVAGGLRRLLESVGLERRAKDIEAPSLREYLAEHYPTGTEEPPQ
jgi:hypothetical protein